MWAILNHRDAFSRDFELTVALDVLLCYPYHNDERRRRVGDAICAELVQTTRHAFPDLIKSLQAAFPDYDSAAIRNVSQRMVFQRERALTAGAAFLPHLKEGMTGEMPLYEGKHQRITGKEIAHYLLKQARRSSHPTAVHQFLKSEVRPWYPVMHLAAAFQFHARQRWHRFSSGALDYQDIAFFRNVLRTAHDFEKMIRSMPALSGPASKLVSLSWADPLLA
jgi:hypothetical protein